MAATIKDIARETGLGLATISSYLNGGNVREKNRIKIEKAIDKLHFEVNEVARGLRTNITKTVGVVIPELNMLFCAEIITAMEDILRAHGYATIVCDCRTDRKREQEAVDFLIHKRVDGLINMPVDKSGAHLKSFMKTGKPIVLIDREIESLVCDSILVDNEAAAYQAVELFYNRGHRRIGMIAGRQDVSAALERKNGFLKAVNTFGMDTDESCIFYGNDDMNSGVDGIRTLLCQKPELTGVFAANHAMTVGAVIGINEMGLQMGKEISLVGFDNRQFARACNPQLTIVAQPTEAIAKSAAELMLSHLIGIREEERFVKKIKTQVICGKSVCDLKKSGA